MATVRIFLGWDQPLCETVPAWLLQGCQPGCLDLRTIAIVVPTRQAAWRLRGALPWAAHQKGIRLIGPDIVTPRVLLEPRPETTMASQTEEILAWRAALASIRREELPEGLPAAGRDPELLCPYAGRFRRLRSELADGDLCISEVAESGHATEEAERWRQMAILERRYEDLLNQRGLTDRANRQRENARRGRLPAPWHRIILAAVPDPPNLLLTLLTHWARESGRLVEVLVAAPEAEADAFDGWGRPRPEVWERRVIPVRDEQIYLEAGPREQALRIANLVEAGCRTTPPSGDGQTPHLAIGAVQSETIEELKRALADIGLRSFDPRERLFSDTSLFRLIERLVAFVRDPGYAELAALFRHPAVLNHFPDTTGVLAELDRLQSEHLPVMVDDLVRLAHARAAFPAFEQSCAASLAAALEQLMAWRQALSTSPTPPILRQVLQDIFSARAFAPEKHASDILLHQAATELDSVLREFERAFDSGGWPGLTEWMDILLTRLREIRLPVERREEPLDIEGWLELLWNPAPHLFVADMNEGAVPDSILADPFLPDALRRRLGLRDDRRRLARDAYVLTALLAQRRSHGQVILTLAKHAANGDPLRPSRLLFRCRDNELVARARTLFASPQPLHIAAPFSISFQLDPSRIAPQNLSASCGRRLNMTAFRDYLQCPLRFFFKHVLRMERCDDRARDLDALAFGQLVHRALEDMARDPLQPWAWEDAERLGEWLAGRVQAHATLRYGVRPWLGVTLAVQSAAQRLRAFAHHQVRWHAAGWDLVAPPELPALVAFDGSEVHGRIDRVDRHRESGAFCVLDYKTADRKQSPMEAHVGGAMDGDEFFAEAMVPSECIQPDRGTKTRWRWADLQLPLYAEYLKQTRGVEHSVTLGYVCLPAAGAETGFYLWESYSQPLHASALRCARAVLDRIRRGIFWPPRVTKMQPDEEFFDLLLGDPWRTLRPPLEANAS